MPGRSERQINKQQNWRAKGRASFLFFFITTISKIKSFVILTILSESDVKKIFP